MSKTHNPEVNLHVKLLKMITQASIYLNNFPKYEKYGLAQQIRNVMYDIYNLVTECQKRYHKKTTLTTLDIKHEQLRMLFKLAHELNYFHFKHGTHGNTEKEANRKYLFMSSMVNEIGSMIGGWIKLELK